MLVSENCVDVMCITESWLHEEEHSIRRQISEFDYQLINLSRGSRGGGVAVISRNGLTVKRCKSNRTFSSFECLEVTVEGRGVQLTRAAVVYRPPDVSKQTAFLDEFGDFLSDFTTMSGHLVLTGDFNIHIEKPSCSFSDSFLQIVGDQNWYQKIDQPTHINGGWLDLVLTNDDYLLSDVDVLPTPEVPDHFLVSFNVHCGSSNRPCQKKTVVSRCMRRVTVEAITEMIQKSELKGPTFPGRSLTECVEMYDELLLEILDELAPLEEKTLRIGGKPRWFDVDCYTALKSRRGAERRYRRLYKKKLKKPNRVTYEELDLAEREFVREVRYARSVFRRARREFFRRRLQAAEGNPSATYQVMNYLLGKDKTPKALPTVTDPAKLPDLLSEFFHSKVEMIYQDIRNDPAFSEILPDLPDTRVTTSVPVLASFKPVSDEQLASTIRRMNQKHCSLDPIPTSLLTGALPHLLPILSKIVNSSLSQGEMPDNLKTAVIRPAHKNASLDPDQLKSYRPISNLSFLSKVVEKCVAEQLVDHLEKHGLFAKFQSAYRTKHSCETATVKIVNDILLQIDSKSQVILMLLDLSAAFDTISHSELLRRLENEYRIGGRVLKWIKSYLSGRSAKVKIGSTESSSKPIEIGVPQGSILGPLLFILYMKDLEKIAALYDLTIHLYADDSQIYVSFSPESIGEVTERLQKCMAHIKMWMAHSMLKLNPDKTEVLVLKNKWNKAPDIEKILINPEDGETEVAPRARNLGVMFDSTLSMADHVTKVVKACNLQLIQMWRIAGKLSKAQKTKLVSTLIHSRIDYCNSLLVTLKESDLKRLQKVQNSATRYIYGKRGRRGVTKLRMKSHFLPVKQRIEYKICLMVYKTLHDQSPPYMSEMLVRRPQKVKSLRVDNDVTALKEVRRSEYHYENTRGAFSIAAPKLWNQLPRIIRDSESLATFKTSLKTHLFHRAYNQ